MKRIINRSGTTQSWMGKEIVDSGYLDLDEFDVLQFRYDSKFDSDIESGDLVVSDGVNEFDADIGKSFLYEEKFSCAVDLDNEDEIISGNDWIEIPHKRVIWDTLNLIDAVNNDFIVPYDGVFTCDLKLRIKDMSNVTAVEVALFKRGDPDDYWFIMSYHDIVGDSILDMSGSTPFDMYTGEIFTLKIKLYGTSAEALIGGNDDYTAFGYTFHHKLVSE